MKESTLRLLLKGDSEKKRLNRKFVGLILEDAFQDQAAKLEESPSIKQNCREVIDFLKDEKEPEQPENEMIPNAVVKTTHKVAKAATPAFRSKRVATPLPSHGETQWSPALKPWSHVGV